MGRISYFSLKECLLNCNPEMPSGGSEIPPGNTGVFGGGFDGGQILSTLQYINISTPSDASLFGYLSLAIRRIAATSNGTNNRGIFGSGTVYFGSSYATSVLDYINITSIPSNSSRFGYLSTGRTVVGATSNGTNNRGIFGGGVLTGASSPYLSTIEYITISTPSDSSLFGYFDIAMANRTATSNGTNNRGIFAAGSSSNMGAYSTIDYVTISTLCNATHFGYFDQKRNYLTATSNGTNNRGIFAGGGIGGNATSVIDYLTISTLGNARFFGFLTVERVDLASTSNGTGNKGVIGGGFAGYPYYTYSGIDQVNISQFGNATSFGNLMTDVEELAATSNA